MGFARAVDHLDGDELSITDLVVPRPNASFIYRVPDSRLAHAAVLPADVVIVERGQALRSGRFALVTVAGEPRLVQVFRDGRRVTFDGVSSNEDAIEVLGIASRIVRQLVP